MNSQITEQFILVNQLNLAKALKFNQDLVNSMLNPNTPVPTPSAPTSTSFIQIRDLPAVKGPASSPAKSESGTWSGDSLSENIHYETFKQIKQEAERRDPKISKEEIYENLMKPYKYEKRDVLVPITERITTVYRWKYSNCNKEYTKIWNLLDHVRMHEGIKPHKWHICEKTFTQKSNLNKHLKQHEMVNIKDRKKYACSLCDKKYTENYNLMAHMRKSHPESKDLPKKSRMRV